MNKELIEKLKQVLETEKKSLEKELQSFARKDDIPKGDWETKYPNREDRYKDEEANEVEDYDNLLPVEYGLELKLKDVNTALEKIAQGKYGICENCGKEITEERLLACPEAKTCLKCNEK